MFEAQILASLKSSAKVLEDTYNRNLESGFLVTARNWAQAVQPGEVPVAPFAQSVTVNEETMGLVVIQTATRVSDLDPRTLLPKYGTDVQGSNSPVGTPIPGSTGRFHQASWANPQHGDLYPPDAPKFKYEKPYPFGGYWEAIS